MQGKSLSKSSAGCFWFLVAKEAVEVIEASDVIRTVEVIEAIEATEVFRTTQILRINNIVARITLFRCFETKTFFE